MHWQGIENTTTSALLPYGLNGRELLNEAGGADAEFTKSLEMAASPTELLLRERSVGRETGAGTNDMSGPPIDRIIHDKIE